jgi:toxin ParE1/3/4
VTRPQPALSPAAHADVLHAVQHYNEQQPLLGFEFLDELEHTAELIRETPLLSSLVDPPIRRALLKRFPYGVFFAPGADDEPDVIVAVIDLRQDPDVVRQAYKR